jgi:hypothetical protein
MTCIVTIEQNGEVLRVTSDDHVGAKALMYKILMQENEDVVDNRLFPRKAITFCDNLPVSCVAHFPSRAKEPV